MAGLPSPQIIAIARTLHPRLRALPIDARPVGHGICVVDIPSVASPYTAVYWAKSVCPLVDLPPRIARGVISARAFGRHLPPFLDMVQQVSALSLWSDSAPSFSAGRTQPSFSPALEGLQDLRDLADETFTHSGDVSAMLHLPGGPPVQVWVQRHHSLDIMEDTASSPGAFPRGTDAALHFLLDLDDSCPRGHTIFLLDGRALGPSGPPFRTLILPQQIPLAALLEAAHSLFPDATVPNALRVNGRLVTRWEARDYAFPLVRLLAGLPLSTGSQPHDGSCIPAIDIAHRFPGIALALQQNAFDSLADAPVELLEFATTALPPRNTTVTPPSMDALDEPLPFLLEVPIPHPLVQQAEIVVFSLHFQAFRLWIPATFTMHQLQWAISQGTGVMVHALRWPRVIPCLAGSPAVVIASLVQDNIQATLGIVDARRVYPSSGPALWLVSLPHEIQSVDLTVLALDNRQVVANPQLTRIDGRRCLGLLRFRQGVFVLTISANFADTHDCVDWQHPSDLPIGLQMSAFPRGSLSPGSSTTTSTSTFVLDQPSRSLTSTTSTTTGAASENSQRVTFYLTSGLFPPLIFHAGDTLDCANLLASAAFHFFEKRVSPPMTTWILSKRAFQLSNGRWAVFLCSGHSTHEPAQAAVWVDAGTAWPHPYMIHVPCFAAWPQVKSRIFLPLDPDALVTVNGVLWDGSSHFFANGFVLQIRARSEHLISQSLLPFANRFSGLLALQCPCNGPATVGWQDLRPDTQRERFLCHFRERLNGCRPVSQCLDPFSHVLLYVQGSGVFRFSANTRLPARDVDVQHYFHRWLAGSVGDGIVQDLKFVWGECCLFVVRLADCEDTLWVHLDGDSIDFWELATSQDLSQIPTLDGQVL